MAMLTSGESCSMRGSPGSLPGPQFSASRAVPSSRRLACAVRALRTIARIARATGHQAIWIDLEHSTIPIDTAASICAVAMDIGLASLVRVPEREYGVIGQLLDSGVLGIIAPRIESVEEAQDVVAACRFPPLGPPLGRRHIGSREF